MDNRLKLIEKAKEHIAALNMILDVLTAHISAEDGKISPEEKELINGDPGKVGGDRD